MGKGLALYHGFFIYPQSYPPVTPILLFNISVFRNPHFTHCTPVKTRSFSRVPFQA